MLSQWPAQGWRSTLLFQAENGSLTWLALSVHMKSKQERSFGLIGLATGPTEVIPHRGGVDVR